MANETPYKTAPVTESADHAGPAASGDSTQTEKASFDDFAARLDKARGIDVNDKNAPPSQGTAMGLGMKLASELIAALLVGFVLGLGIDLLFNTKPFFLLLGITLGFAAAFLNVLRMMRKLAKEQENANNAAQSTDGASPSQTNTSQ